MKTTVLDSYALLAYFEKEEGWNTVAQLLADAARNRCRLCGCVVNWGEVLYITERTYGPEKAEEVDALLEDLPIGWIEADRTLTREAARFKVDGGLAYADCFAAALARQEDGAVVGVRGDHRSGRRAVVVVSLSGHPSYVPPLQNPCLENVRKSTAGTARGRTRGPRGRNHSCYEWRAGGRTREPQPPETHREEANCTDGGTVRHARQNSIPR